MHSLKATVNVYTVVVFRAPSSVADLESLMPDIGALSPTFRLPTATLTPNSDPSAKPETSL